VSASNDLLAQWLKRRLPADQWLWLDERRRHLERDGSERERDIAFGLVPRRLGRKDLQPTAQELADADAIVSGWDPTDWSVETAARALLLIDLCEREPGSAGRHFRELGEGADLGESMTLCRLLPLLPADADVEQQVAAGLRTNMRAVFEAITHRNPYPRLHFNTHRWNHMVLKALFIDSTLAPIQGLDERANDELAGMLCHYAHERWAAARPLSPELWRCVGPFARAERFDDLLQALETSETTATTVAVLNAISQSPDPRRCAVLNAYAEPSLRVANGSSG